MTLIQLKQKVLGMFNANKVSPEPMYLLGSTIMDFTERIGRPMKRTTDGMPIICTELYRVDQKGIFLV